ncbi:Cna B-type domain-containing protein [Lachnoclostridium sp. Marseille-P6806]|uniref:Cna B-type domain-containing protein n=1 Tax=Lachnoclostridium sp. Marseille-P6806 TaxID=2364793 RepID=UPI0013EF5579|nr:Cna B-type domain-containing protein [Lachnoclostridium sp. Marseille-P6806]
MQKIRMTMWRLFLSALLIALLFPARAEAAGSIDTGRDVTLTLRYIHEGKAISGATFTLYKVAEVDAYGTFTRTPAFSGYPLHTESVSGQGWTSLALTLSGYALRDQLPPSGSGKTDGNGTLTFPTDGGRLKPGLYLVVGEKCVADGYLYTASPFLVMLPGAETEKNDWRYALTVSPKHERKKEQKGGMTSRRVLKLWDDAGSESLRPAGVTVDLLRNREVYATVTLNKDNNWRFTWEKLSESDDWTVVERELPGYTVKTERSGTTDTITNTRHTTPSPEAGRTAAGKRALGTKLPQTGQLWWPVQLLAVSGMALILLGILHRRGE